MRVYPSGSRVYRVQTRAGGKSRRLNVGRHGLISAEQARRKAARIIADIKAGNEPVLDKGASGADAGPTVADVAERYMREHVMVRCKPTTVRHCRHALDRHLLPTLGTLRLGEIGRERVAALHYSLHETPVMANQIVDMLSRLFYAAEGWGIVPEGGNPCRFVHKYKERSCERFLSEGVAKDTVYRWVDTQGLPAHRVGRLFRFRLSQVDEWVENSADHVAASRKSGRADTKGRNDLDNG